MRDLALLAALTFNLRADPFTKFHVMEGLLQRSAPSGPMAFCNARISEGFNQSKEGEAPPKELGDLKEPRIASKRSSSRVSEGR